ncbi:TraB/GumN family protein [Peptoniphilus harei]|uniref:TraB family protein n=1 Tax=Peptoniphilus harei TaxID=54005 RepID=A0A2X1ZZI0_9FIRM|nr:TraB/GumN family protein [Peptoniphilus harei]QQT91124.1 TraB/GumN family protein [Peptoniphilus harei]SPY48756.1 TraB family protein [Peptoniphilus harei]
MKEQLIRIDYQGKEIILIPTAHVSQESVNLVRETIKEENPDSICIELDDQRYKNLKNPEAWKNTNIIDIIKEKKVTLLIANLILSSYQKNIAKKLKTKPGQEMMEGMKASEEMGINLVLADRSIQTTFMRIWRKMGFFEKIKLFFSLMSIDDDEDVSEEDLQRLIERDNLELAIEDMGKDYPQIAATLLHERDKYLAYNIKNAPGNKVVAILGAAHTPGVEEEVFKDQDIEELDKVPPKSFMGKLLPWIIPALIVILIVLGFKQSMDTGFSQIKSWFIFNSVFAAIFTALCLPHPLSVLTAFVAAPFTSINPVLACGWFAGLVEASLKKPTVEDVNNIPDDIFNIKSWIHNKFLKALLVVILANLGSSIGTIIAGSKIIQSII